MSDSLERLRRELPVVAIFGPTGIGKTAVAIELSRLLARSQIAAQAVSADAMQVYRGLETLTGAATAAQRAQLPHHLLSCIDVDHEFDVSQFAQIAHQAIDRIRASGQLAIVVGGTGLYLRAALCELDLLPPPPAGLRDQLEAELALIGPTALHARLEELDPAAAEAVDPANGRRIIRALEAQSVGRSAGERAANRLWTEDVRLPTRLFGLTQDRAVLYEAIDSRVDQMVMAGAAGEVERAQRAGAGRTARQALGFSELLEGDIDAMKQNTRRYAKRQLTWLRKLPGKELIDITGQAPDQTAAEIFAALDGD